MLIIGCGRLGGIFARIWREREPDDPLVCTVRNPESRARLAGFDVRVLDLLDAGAVEQTVAGHGRILVSVVGEAAWTRGMENLARVLEPEVHVLQISSTGVYAEDDGGEVREDSPLVQGSPLVSAEDALSGSRATVLRCSGLVDPGHEPRRMLEAFAGTSRPDGWLNLVRRDDVAEVALEAFVRSITGTYNVSATSILRSEFIDRRLAEAGLDPVEWIAGQTGKRVVCDALERSFAARLTSVT
jgi:uncharacterized protein YbjT (DUF2867 family)